MISIIIIIRRGRNVSISTTTTTTNQKDKNGIWKLSVQLKLPDKIYIITKSPS